MEVSEINAFLAGLVADHPDICSLTTLAELPGGYLHVLHFGVSEPSTNRRSVLFFGGEYGREWISPACLLFLANELANKYGVEPSITRMLNQADVYIVPCVNPAGYSYSFWNLRPWVKNRSVNSDGSFGVNLARNWDYNWGGADASFQTTSDVYVGTGPFSEVETQLTRSKFQFNTPLDLAVEVLGNGRRIMWPYGAHAATLPPSTALMYESLAREMARRAGAVNGAAFETGSYFELAGAAGGLATDWFFHRLAVKALTISPAPDIEVTPGYVLPPSEIHAAVTEVAEACLFAAHWATSDFAVVLIGEPATEWPAGSPAQIDFEVLSGPWTPYSPGSGVVHFRVVGQTTFQSRTAELLYVGRYRATIPAFPCGPTVEYYIEVVNSEGAANFSPMNAPVDLYQTEVVVVTALLEDDAETDLGWTLGLPDDTATRGQWRWAAPQKTTAQPAEDHTPGAGTLCFVTDNRAGTTVGQYDVDGGRTTLVSPIFDLAGIRARISYWRWYWNGGEADADPLIVEVSNNAGQTWVTVEEVDTASGEAEGGWFQHTFDLRDFVPPTDQVQLRFIAKDEGDSSIVEALVDDLRIDSIACNSVPGDMDGDGDVDLADWAALSVCMGGPDESPSTDCTTAYIVDFDIDGDVDLEDVAYFVQLVGD